MNTRVHPARHRAPMTPDVMPQEAVLPVDDKRKLLRYVLAALAYRTQKALRDAPAEFKNFRAAEINPERLGSTRPSRVAQTKSRLKHGPIGGPPRKDK
jgi:hypothetical protein